MKKEKVKTHIYNIIKGDKMDYSKWISKTGEEFNLKDMTITYIRNCMFLIIRSINRDFENKDKILFDELWIEENGRNYLDSFYNELKIRGSVDIN